MGWFWVRNGRGGERVKLFAGSHDKAIVVMRARWRENGIETFGVQAKQVHQTKAEIESQKRGDAEGGGVMAKPGVGGTRAQGYDEASYASKTLTVATSPLPLFLRSPTEAKLRGELPLKPPGGRAWGRAR